MVQLFSPVVVYPLPNLYERCGLFCRSFCGNTEAYFFQTIQHRQLVVFLLRLLVRYRHLLGKVLVWEHFLSTKHRCLIEKNVTTALFCPTDGSAFLRVQVKGPQATDIYKLNRWSMVCLACGLHLVCRVMTSIGLPGQLYRNAKMSNLWYICQRIF